MVSATNGREAVEVAARELPHLIVMDVMMRRWTAWQPFGSSKKAELTKGIPVIVITASVSAHDASRHEAQSSGASGFFDEAAQSRAVAQGSATAAAAIPEKPATESPK